MNGLELALKLIPVAGSKSARLTLGTRLSTTSRTYPWVSTSTRGWARTNASRKARKARARVPRVAELENSSMR